MSRCVTEVRRRHLELPLHCIAEGSTDDLQKFARRVDELAGVDAEIGAGDTLVLRLSDSASRAATLAEVLRLAESAQLPLQRVSSGQNETEDVYLQLLQEDEAHGFHRFHFENDSANDALRGDTPT